MFGVERLLPGTQVADSNLNIDHSNFYNNTLTADNGAVHATAKGKIEMEWCVFQGNTLDITGNNQMSVLHCIFDREVPSDVIDEGGNRVIADAPSWYLY
jgi:hypothetical protein